MIAVTKIKISLQMPDDCPGNYNKEYGMGTIVRRAIREEIVRNWLFSELAFILWQREIG